MLTIVHAADATSPVIASTTDTQTSTIRRACCRAQMNSSIAMPAEWPVIGAVFGLITNRLGASPGLASQLAVGW